MARLAAGLQWQDFGDEFGHAVVPHVGGDVGRPTDSAFLHECERLAGSHRVGDDRENAIGPD